VNFLYHKSNPLDRKSIDKQGLLPQRGEQWLRGTDIKGKAIFATTKKDLFNSTYDDDIWEINLSLIPTIKWFIDPNYENKNHLYTQQPIPKNAIKLIKQGSGEPISETKQFIKQRLREELNIKYAVIEIKIPMAYMSWEKYFQIVPYHNTLGGRVQVKKSDGNIRSISTKNIKVLKVFNENEKEEMNRFIQELRINREKELRSYGLLK
jgi:hypothetical protein